MIDKPGDDGVSMWGLGDEVFFLFDGASNLDDAASHAPAEEAKEKNIGPISVRVPTRDMT
jgi:hypothetical protein